MIVAVSRSEQWRRVCRTVCACHSQGHRGSIPGTPTMESHAFSPSTSVRSRKSAVASAFVRPSYNGMVGVVHGMLGVVHGVFHVVAFRFY